MVSVCVVNWRTADETLTMAASLPAGAGDLPWELIVADNASGDGSVERLSEALPHATVFDTGGNLGFGTGVNRAAEKASGDWLFILNPDTVVHERAIQVLVEYLSENPDVGAVGPKMVDAAGSRQASARSFPTAAAAMFRHTLLGRLFPSNRYAADYLMSDLPQDRPSEVDWLSGSAMMFPRRAFEAVDGFDEDFFMYCEDIDICRRLWDEGHRVVYHPGATVEHTIGAASDKAQAAMIREHHRSMLKYYRKHLVHDVPWLLRPTYPVGIGLRHAVRQLHRWSLEQRHRRRRR
jgi:hypothetical protein